MIKVLQIGPSRKNKGGITTVLNMWEHSGIWKDYGCKWIETQDNRGFLYKVFYFVRSILLTSLYISHYDIVHFHTTPGRSMIVQMPIFLLSILYRKKRVVHLHVGNQLNDFNNDKVVKWFLKKSDKIVVLACVWKELLINKYNTPREKVIVLYNPAPNVEVVSQKEKYVLFMSYLTKNKGYDILLKAFSQVVQNNKDWKLVIAGAGEIVSAKKMVDVLHLTQNVEFYEWVQGENKKNLLMHAGVFCMASYMEGFPMSVLEAWAYGVPLITTPVGGLPDVLIDGQNAMVFQFGNVNELIEKMKRLLTSDDLRFRLSNAGHRLAEEVFNMKVIKKEIELLYSDLS